MMTLTVGLWVPHYEWGPAWVVWRRSEGYYGWAPMGPGISVEVAVGGGYRVPDERWIFVNDRDISRPDIERHFVDRSTNTTIINNSTVINNTYVDNSRHTTYVAGPKKEEVQKVTGAAIKPVTIRETDRPGQALNNDQLQIYRPRVQAGNNNGRKPVPSKLVNLKEVKPVSERMPGNQLRNENPPANGKEQSTQEPNAGNKVAGEQPRIVNPPDKQKSTKEFSVPQTAKPFDNKGTGLQPRAANLSDKNNNLNQQPKPKNVRPHNKKRQLPKPAPPPNNNGKNNDSQSPKPKQDGSPSSQQQT